MNRMIQALLLTLVALIGTSPNACADKVDDLVVRQMERQHIPGLSIAVVKNGKLVKARGYGIANIELDVRARPETVYMIGSVSKQLIASGVMALVVDGKVGLDDSVRKYFEDAPEAWQPITVRHLLTHTSGLVRESPAYSRVKPQPDAELIKASYVTPLAFRTGDKYQYSNLGYFVLAELITRVSQKPWPQFMQDRLFGPLGMKDTRTTSIQAVIPHRANGYNWTGEQFENVPLTFGVRPSGAFLSTALDLARWDAALYSDQLFSREQRELLWTPMKLNDGSESPYGFGWQVEKVGSHRAITHNGALDGFRAGVARYIDDGLTVIVLTNLAFAQPEPIARGIADLYVPDILPTRRAAKVPADVLDPLAGAYVWQGTSRTLNVARKGNLLEVTASQGPTSFYIATLAPESPTQFFNEDDPRGAYVFSTDPQTGATVLIARDDSGKEVLRGTQPKR